MVTVVLLRNLARATTPVNVVKTEQSTGAQDKQEQLREHRDASTYRRTGKKTHLSQVISENNVTD